MSLNIGGIYVGVKDGITPEAVAARVDTYWRALGAKPFPGNPLDLEPLSLSKTGRLGFAIAPEGEDERGERWIAVYDSERYDADADLARYLVEELDVPVVFYKVSGASGDYAFVKVYGTGGPTPPKRNATQAWLEGFPNALVYFNHLKKAGPELEAWRIFAFEDVPYRAGAKYRGPSPEERRELSVEARMEELAAASDAESILELERAHPDAAENVLNALDDVDQSTLEGRAYVAALAGRALEAEASLYAVAESAARQKDEELLARVLGAMGTRGYLWGLMEGRAATCLSQGEVEVGFRLLRAACEGPCPSQTAWNNFAFALAKLEPRVRPSSNEVRPLLERALAEAPMNVPIFHNVACGAVAVGLHDLAFEAVRGAVKHGYAQLDALKADDELAPIASDPRFHELFEAAPGRTTLADVERLVLTLKIKQRAHVVHRPVFGMTFYFGGKLATITPNIGKLLDAYVADVPPGAVAYRGDKPLRKAMLTKDRNSLAEWKKGRDFLSLKLSSTDGDAAEFEFSADGDDEDKKASVTLAWPLAEARSPDALEQRFIRYATLSKCESAHAGLDVRNRDSGTYEGIEWERMELAERFLAFQGDNAWWKSGRTPPAHWLVWLSKPMAKKLPKLRTEIGDAKLGETPEGVAIRAARVPPLAPAAHPDDCGALPDVARALAPLRIKATGSENAAYLARWDNVPGLPYENGDGVSDDENAAAADTRGCTA